ncbi:GT-D fold domain-containing glycosyltransferase [Sphingobacterium daejeonense]|uniref:GT-D fold domain-containing glycosyltransferase n=1 Tax=Sphingobacterium daejeonense TaxID=371142 RepID=UPI001484EFEC|nr:GT-D fold domain-containing glycosyltransferase [Sphingobacterium daejeonense]
MWENEDLLIIESKGSGLGKDKTIYQNSKSIQRIECPNSNTYNHYQEIFSAAKELGQNKLIILALGPTATVMAYDLAKEGFRALDLGHLELENYFYQTQATAETEINGIKIGQVETIQNDPLTTMSLS